MNMYTVVMTLFTVFFTASCFRYFTSARRESHILTAQRWQVQQRLGANLANGIVSSASCVSKRQKMTPIMAGASCDFLVLCLNTASAQTVFFQALVVYVLQIRSLFTH